MPSRHTLAVALTLTLALVLPSCATPPTPTAADELGAWMSGTFSSVAQAEADPTYFEVQLVMTPIWTDRDDGPWLYVEQAVASALARPYRQRVYHVVDRGAGALASEVYELPGDPLAFAGAWAEPQRFDELAPEDLSLRVGCTIELTLDGERYVGSTRDAECKSSLRGASYATSEVEITPDRLTSWDRGFDADGKQVWGAVKGPYVFDRLPAEAPAGRAQRVNGAARATSRGGY